MKDQEISDKNKDRYMDVTAENFTLEKRPQGEKFDDD